MIAAFLFAAVGAVGATFLEGDGIRLAFDTAEKGFNCIGIENHVTSASAAFCGDEPGRAGF